MPKFPGIMLDLTDHLEMRIVYAALRLFHGDYPEDYKGSMVWQTELERIMERFPEDFRKDWERRTAKGESNAKR